MAQPATATRNRNRDRLSYSAAEQPNGTDPSSILLARDHRPNSSRPPTPRSASFFTCLFPPWASFRPLASIPNAILAFPQEPRTALKAPLDLCCSVQYDQGLNFFVIDSTQRPRTESSFFHTHNHSVACLQTRLQWSQPLVQPNKMKRFRKNSLVC